MKITSTVRPRDWTPPDLPGLLIGVDNPSNELAAQYQKILGLSAAPKHALFGIPANSMQSTELGKAVIKQSTEFEKAVVKMSLKAAKDLTTHFANQPGVPEYVRVGVKVTWLGVNLYSLYDSWQDPNHNIPALMIQSTGAALTALGIGSQVTGYGTDFFENIEIQDNIGAVMTAAEAGVNNRDISLALMNREIQASDAGKILAMVSPIIEAGLNEDTKYGKVKFGPLPELVLPPNRFAAAAG